MQSFFPRICFSLPTNKSLVCLTYHHPQPTPDLPTLPSICFPLCTALLYRLPGVWFACDDVVQTPADTNDSERRDTDGTASTSQ